MSSGVLLMFLHLLYLGPGLARTIQSFRSRFLRHLGTHSLCRESVDLMCVWAFQSSQIQLLSPVAMILLSPCLCHPFVFSGFLSSGVQNALKTSVVTLPGTPRNHQYFLCFTVLVIHLVTVDRAYSVSRKDVSTLVTLTRSSVLPRTSESVNS